MASAVGNKPECNVRLRPMEKEMSRNGRTDVKEQSIKRESVYKERRGSKKKKSR